MSKTIVIGGGFVGLFTVLHLSHHKYPQSTILIDQKNYFVFNPLLYELMTGEMTPDQVCPTYRELLKGSNVTFLEDQVNNIDLEKQVVYLNSNTQYHYDNLVLVLGKKSSYFGVQGAEKYAFSFRSRDDAGKLSQHLQKCLQKASQTEDDQSRQRLLTFTIVGGGPTGIEMVGTLADLLFQWYDKLGGNPKEIRIILVSRPKQLLKGDINSHLIDLVKKAFQNRPIKIDLILGASATKVTESTLEYQKEEQTHTIATNTVIWTAGTDTNPVIDSLPIASENRARNGSLYVLPTLQLPDYPNVFAAGDCAVLSNQSLPATAQVAYQQGKAIAHNLIAKVNNDPLEPAKVKLRGSMMKLGINESVANIFDRIQVSGEVGHLIREATYLELLPSPIHDFKVTTNWIIDEIFHRHNI